MVMAAAIQARGSSAKGSLREMILPSILVCTAELAGLLLRAEYQGELRKPLAGRYNFANVTPA
jgi:hypothetical protein